MRGSKWLLMAAFLLFAQPTIALAGMPTPVLTEWGSMRIGAAMFFAGVVLGAAAMFRWLWNVLAKDFARLPRLTYGKSLAAVLLVGFALAVVLTMIAGARELLTPGAWKRQGALYAVEGPAPPPADPQRTDDRKENLRRLKQALWQYAASHNGRFPGADDRAVADAPWIVPGGAGMRYLYAAGQTAGDGRRLLAFEPAVHPDPRFVLFTDGDVAGLSSAEIRRQLDEEQRP